MNSKQLLNNQFLLVFFWYWLWAHAHLFDFWALLHLLGFWPVNAEQIRQIYAGYLFLHLVFVLIFTHHNNWTGARPNTFWIIHYLVCELGLAAEVGLSHLRDVKSFNQWLLLWLVFFSLKYHFVAPFHEAIAVMTIGKWSVQLLLCLLKFGIVYLGLD